MNAVPGDGDPGVADRAAAAVARIRELLATTADELGRAGAATEALARFEPATRRMLVTRKSRMVPLGRVWRLGVLLLDADARLYATGSITRALDPKWPQHVAVSAEVRREQRGAAFRGPFEHGESVNFDAEPIELTVSALRAGQGPVFLDGDAVLVRWAGGAAHPRPFADYLRERVGMIEHPPEGDGRTLL